MDKFWAVLKREYKKIVWTWTFIISTLLAPILLIGISVVPMFIFSLKGEPIRLALVEQSGNVSARLKENLSPEKQLENFKKANEDAFKKVEVNQQEKLKDTAQQFGGTFVIEELKPDGKSVESLRQELSERINKETLDAYLIIPENFDSTDAKFDFYARNASDFITKGQLENAVEESVRAERLAKANISEEKLREINQKINFSVTKVSQKGEEKDNDLGFAVGFTLAMIIYISLTLYGSVIMGAIIEEKETRIAEILFSSAKPFELMMGKLVGVGLASLTQVAIWLGTAGIVAGYFLTMASMSGLPIPLPSFSVSFILLFLLFFLLGFFCYAAIYAIIGAMVTTSQEGQQFVFPPILISLVGLYSVFLVIRDPNSTYSFVASITPFISPIVMPVRIFIDMPPIWEILLAILLNVGIIFLITWIAAKVYRTGMLMYGKRATIPEVLRWIRTS